MLACLNGLIKELTNISVNKVLKLVTRSGKYMQPMFECDCFNFSCFPYFECANDVNLMSIPKSGHGFPHKFVILLLI